MKGFIIVADAARAHQDGTFSLLRGGIDRVHALRTDPIQLHASLVTRITGTLSEVGEHAMEIRFINEEGQSVSPDIKGGFIIPEGGGSAAAVLNFSLILPRYGRYTFTLKVDRQEIDSWEIRAVELPNEPKQKREE